MSLLFRAARPALRTVPSRCFSTAVPATEPAAKAASSCSTASRWCGTKTSVCSRISAFVSGFALAGSAGFYMLYFQAAESTRELTMLTNDVAKKQADMEKRLFALEQK
eukprot:GDKI01031922.1.p2 GENE.GDKI01031922.1~~GDKI01031922.1.p2  ORF type:complete len:108 (-),score=19.82 GDKI01031922.1:377-700(-)